MNIALATDHAGYEAKERVRTWLEAEGATIVDFGATSHDPQDDYPDFIEPAAKAVSQSRVDRAIIFGGSGQGEAIVANRFSKVRAVVYYGGDTDILRLARQHNDANVLSIGARFVNQEQLMEHINLWLNVPFTEEARHKRRIAKIDSRSSARYDRLIEQIGWVGVALVVGAYIMNVLGVLSGDDLGYLLANSVGALGIMVDARKDKNTQAVVLNAVWLGIGLLGIVQFLWS